MSNELNLLQITKTPRGKDWQCYQCQIGLITIEVLAIPAQTMNEYQWARINQARASYAPMWSPTLGKVVEQDPFDGLNPFSPYRVIHYIATATSREGFEKVVTMRKVTLPSGFDASKQALPEDIIFWQVVNNLTGEVQSLWQLLQSCLGVVLNHAVLATMSRTGTYLSGLNPAAILTPDQKALIQDMSILGFALIQLAATVEDNALLWFCQLCQEFQEKQLARKV